MALWKEQPVAEPAPLADDSVQRVVGIVHDAQQLVKGSPEGPALCRPQNRPA